MNIINQFFNFFYASRGINSNFLKIESRLKFCDEKIPVEHREKSIELLNSAKHTTFIQVQYNTQNEEDKKDYGEECTIYISENNDIYLFKLYIENICLFGLIKNKQYLFLGCDYYHPFIKTSEFSYANSDGSGPEFNDIDSDKDILLVLEKYFVKFCNNKYH